MTDRNKSQDREWPSVRSRWREQEQNIRAPSTMVSDVFREYEHQKSRRRYIRFGIAAAASLVLVIVSLVTQFSTQDENQPIQVPDMPIASAPLITTGPCDLAGSCVDLHEKLARVDIGWPDNTETFGVLMQ